MSYCRKCGQPKQEWVTDRFSESTGERVMESKCTNPKCEKGCWNTGGHIPNGGWFRDMLGELSCLRCGARL